MSILDKVKSGGRQLDEGDVHRVKHEFRLVYGWITLEEWDNLPIDELLSDYLFVQEEIQKMESLRICTLKFMGVKNPK